MASLFKYLTGSGKKAPSIRVEAGELSSEDGSEDSFDSDAAGRDSLSTAKKSEVNMPPQNAKDS